MAEKLAKLDDSILSSTMDQICAVVHRWRGQRQVKVCAPQSFRKGQSVDFRQQVDGPMVARLIVEKSDEKAGTVTFTGGVPNAVKVGMLIFSCPVQEVG